MPREKLLTISQAADRIGVHQNTLRGWADRGLVPVVTLPSGHRRFRPSDIERKRMEEATTEEAGRLAVMLNDLLDAGYDIKIRRVGARGTGMTDVWLTPQYEEGHPGHEDWYPPRRGFGTGGDVVDATIFAIGDSVLAEKYGWEPRTPKDGSE